MVLNVSHEAEEFDNSTSPLIASTGNPACFRFPRSLCYAGGRSPAARGTVPTVALGRSLQPNERVRVVLNRS